MKAYVNGINIFDPVTEKKKEIIEYFVKFYGEERRKLITKKINDIVFIFSPFKYNIFGHSVLKTAQRYIEQNNLTEYQDEILAGFEPIYRIFNEIDNDIDKKIKVKLFDLFHDCPARIKDIEFLKKLESYSKEDIEKFSDNRKKDYDYFLNTTKSKLNDITQYISVSSLRHLFKEKSVDMLTIRYNLGYDYKTEKEVLNNNVLNDKLEKLKEFYNSIENERKLRKFNSPVFEDCIKIAQSIDCIEGDLGFIQQIYDYAFHNIYEGGVQYTVINKQGKPVDVIIFPDNAINISTVAIVHEINHSIERSIRLENKRVFNKCGFSYMEYDLDGEDNYNGRNLRFEEPPKRHANKENEHARYMLLNEIFNDLIAVDILNLMNKDKFNLGLKDCSESTSDYSYGFSLLRNFYEQNKDVIIECRLSKDAYSLAKIIGKDNYKRLADIINKWTIGRKKDMPKEDRDFIQEMSDLLYERTNETTLNQN